MGILWIQIFTQTAFFFHRTWMLFFTCSCAPISLLLQNVLHRTGECAALSNQLQFDNWLTLFISHRQPPTLLRVLVCFAAASPPVSEAAPGCSSCLLVCAAAEECRSRKCEFWQKLNLNFCLIQHKEHSTPLFSYDCAKHSRVAALQNTSGIALKHSKWCAVC